MTSASDLVFSVACALARYDGHDCDLGVAECTPPLIVNGKSCSTGPLRPLWTLYSPQALVAINELRRLGALTKE